MAQSAPGDIQKVLIEHISKETTRDKDFVRGVYCGPVAESILLYLVVPGEYIETECNEAGLPSFNSIETTVTNTTFVTQNFECSIPVGVPLGTYDIMIGIKEYRQDFHHTGRRIGIKEYRQDFHRTGRSTKVVQEQLPRDVFEEVDQDDFGTLESKYDDILQTQEQCLRISRSRNSATDSNEWQVMVKPHEKLLEQLLELASNQCHQKLLEFLLTRTVDTAFRPFIQRLLDAPWQILKDFLDNTARGVQSLPITIPDRQKIVKEILLAKCLFWVRQSNDKGPKTTLSAQFIFQPPTMAYIDTSLDPIPTVMMNGYSGDWNNVWALATLLDHNDKDAGLYLSGNYVQPGQLFTDDEGSSKFFAFTDLRIRSCGKFKIRVLLIRGEMQVLRPVVSEEVVVKNMED